MDPATLILKRTCPGDQEENVKAIETLLAKDKASLNAFRAKHCLPFKTYDDVPEPDGTDGEEKRFIMSAYNSSGDKAFRSPWTNRWYLVKDVGDGEEEVEVQERPIPNDEVETRAIEKAANEVWDGYRQLYYGFESVGSVFLKPRGSKGSFEGMFGIQKRTDSNGSWDSVHFVQVEEPNDKECAYRIDSAVVVNLNPYDETSIGCSLSKETVKTCKLKAPTVVASHLENIGTIMEAVETEFRTKMERVDIPKSMEVMQSIYRKQKVGATVHLMDEDVRAATGMGVGASMIGEIANKAKGKRGEGGANPFMAAMKANLEAKEAEAAEKKDVDEGGDQYTDIKSTLKKGSNPMTAEMKKQQRDSGGENLYNVGLKKTSGPQKHTEPVIASPTPEFMNFRNKLKKSGAK